MSNFSDAEDRVLVQLVATYQHVGRRVKWSELDQDMKRTIATTKTPHQLRMRLKTLTNRFGRLVTAFPRRYLDTVNPTDAESPICPAVPAIATPDPPPSTSAHLPSPTHRAPIGADSVLMCFNMMLAGAAPEPIESPRIDQVMLTILGTVDRSIVRQASGKRDENLGELATSGVQELILATGLVPSDIFLDVGCGLGNIVIQVVLQTKVQMSIGVEMRKDVVERAKNIMSRNWSQFPALARAFLIVGDVRTLDLADDPRTKNTTVLFCHNNAFEETSNHALLRACKSMMSLRAVVLGVQHCPRHRQSCWDEFCMTWRLTKVFKVYVTYKGSQANLYMYERMSVA